MYVAILFIVAVLILEIYGWTTGLNDSGLVYDWRKETWVFKPSMYDIMINTIIRM